MDKVIDYHSIDYSLSCRICLTIKRNLKSMTENCSKTIPYLNLFYECTGLILRETISCPMKICYTCERELLSAIRFKRKCFKTEQQLKIIEQLLSQSSDGENKASLPLTKSSLMTEISNNEETTNVLVKQESLSDIFMNENIFQGHSHLTNHSFEDKTKDISEMQEIKEEPTPKETVDHIGTKSGNQSENKSIDIRNYKNKKRKKNEMEPWECKFCVKTFSKKRIFIRHQNSTICKGRPDMNLKCEECQQVFKHKSRYEAHIGKSHYELCPHCGEMIATKYLPKHIEGHENKIANLRPYKCSECNRTFSLQGSLAKHKRLHTNDKRYECEYCHEKFLFWSVRRTHIHKVHLKKGVFQCKYCGKSCNTNSAFLSHVKRMHTLEFRYVCDICSKSFVRKVELNKHKTSHSDVRNFKCYICEKAFKTKRALQTHMMIHTGEKNYICPVCSIAFTQNHVLKTHILKLHPGTEIPPAGTIVSIKALKKMKELEAL